MGPVPVAQKWHPSIRDRALLGPVKIGFSVLGYPDFIRLAISRLGVWEFGVQGFGLLTEGLRFGVSGLGCRVWVLPVSTRSAHHSGDDSTMA